MKPIIFLDIDGVLVSYARLNERHPIDGEHDFVPESVEALNLLIEKLDAEIVISSSWRIGKSIEYLQEILDIRNVKGKVIGKTSYSFSSVDGGRGQEIREWMEEHGIPETFIIIDDEVQDIRKHFRNWWKTHYKDCLQVKDVDRILKRLEQIKTEHHNPTP